MDFIIAANEIYYQLLYYVSGIIILGCSYDWSFVSLAIIILTVIGLLVRYSNKLVASVLILNLAFIFTNYLVILINTYDDVMIEFTSQELIDIINKVALSIGFDSSFNLEASRFIRNIAIFYFSVLCYSLSSTLKIPVS